MKPNNNKCCVRGPKDAGYFPPPRTVVNPAWEQHIDTSQGFPMFVATCMRDGEAVGASKYADHCALTVVVGKKNVTAFIPNKTARALSHYLAHAGKETNERKL